MPYILFNEKNSQCGEFFEYTYGENCPVKQGFALAKTDTACQRLQKLEGYTLVGSQAKSDQVMREIFEIKTPTHALGGKELSGREYSDIIDKMRSGMSNKKRTLDIVRKYAELLCIPSSDCYAQEDLENILNRTLRT